MHIIAAEHARGISYIVWEAFEYYVGKWGPLSQKKFRSTDENELCTTAH